MTREEKNKFISEYLKVNYKGDSYEAYAEQEDLANAMDTAIEWTKEKLFNEVCNYLKDKCTFENPRNGKIECIINLNKFKEAMEE